LDGGKVTGVRENGVVPTEEDIVDDTKVFGGIFGGKSGKPYEGVIGFHGQRNVLNTGRSFPTGVLKHLEERVQGVFPERGL
jgi:hypothetical protein